MGDQVPRMPPPARRRQKRLRDESDESDGDESSAWSGTFASFAANSDDEEPGQFGRRVAHLYAPSEGSTTSASTSRLPNRPAHNQLSGIPGWSAACMGAGIEPVPPNFPTGLPGSWTSWTGDGPFSSGVKIRPVRVLKLGFLARFMLQTDAEFVGDIATQSDPVAQARTVATCAMLGLQTMGIAKGLVCSQQHTELTEMRDGAGGGDGSAMEPEELQKAIGKLNGKLKSYTWRPNRNSSDTTEREQTVPQFVWGLCYGHDEKEQFTGIHLMMLVFDPSFSNDQLVRALMEENNSMKRAGQVNAMPDALRRGQAERQNKLQRAQVVCDELERSADVKYKQIGNVSDYVRMLEALGGKTSSEAGRPYYEDIANDTPAGCAIRPFERDDEFGGRHPLGPCVSHNHKRYEPFGVNVHTAGVLDAKGKPLGIHPSLRDPRDWYDAEGNFEPPQHVRDNGWFYICHDPSVTNLFRAPLPQRMRGTTEPAECLLRIFWDLHKDSSPMLKKAQECGRCTFEQNRDALLSLFHREEGVVDPDQDRVTRAVLNTGMLTADTLDKSRAEEEQLEQRAYRSSTEQNGGSVWTISTRQVVRDLSAEQEKVYAMVASHNRKWTEEVRRAEVAACVDGAAFSTYDAEGETRTRQRAHAEATDAAVRLGLQRFEHTYERKKARPMIPPGWYDIAHVGLKAALREAGEIASRRVASGEGGRLVDPADGNAPLGTANLGQAHGLGYVARDFSTFGQLRQFLMHFLSKDAKISGSDVKLMLEAYMHSFEPFQEACFFFLMCGGPGTGKSMRAKRLQALLCKDWVVASGQASLKAGMNGGMDFLCGRLVYYDEITAEFSSADSERLEYLKSITMEQRVSNTRTIKVAGSNGIDTFKTVVIDSLHFESHLACTNTGMLGLKGDQEPTTSRFALSDRSWAHVVPMAPDEAMEPDFDLLKAPVAVCDRVNRFRVHSCLVAYVLIFLKHQPSCRPNLTYALMLCNKWYEMLDLEYNIPQPSKRKKIKLRMMLELFAVESAVYEKFIVPETGITYADMQPDPETGHLAPFCIEMLADVVRSLQRCLDHEVILTAWSHSLDHSPATSAHVQQIMSTLAGLHGHAFDRPNFAGHVPPLRPSPQEDDDDLGDMRTQHNESLDLPQFHSAEAHGPPLDFRGVPTMATAEVEPMMSSGGLTRRQSERFASEMAVERTCRAEMSHRCLHSWLESGPDAHAQLTKLFTDGRDRAARPMHRVPSTGEVICAKRAAGACMPTVADLLGRGVSENWLKDIASGREARAGDCGGNQRINGTACCNWEYKQLSGAASRGVVGPAGFDFGWARMIDYASVAAAAAPAAAPIGQKKSLWNTVASKIRKVVKVSSQRCFSLMDSDSMTLECVRDALYLAASSDNRRRIPRSAASPAALDASRMRSKNQVFGEACRPTMVHPTNMFQNESMQLSHAFCSATALERPLGSTVAASGYQARVDHLTRNYALPVCIAPNRFKLGSPIEEDDTGLGVYFSKHVASEQANLVVEMAHFLSTVPGIAGGAYTGVPDSFKTHAARTTRRDQGADERLLVETSDPDPVLEFATGLGVAEHAVAHPADDTAPHVAPQSGAAAHVEALATDPDVKRDSLPYSWDMFATFATLRAIDTLHNDSEPYINRVRAKCPDVFCEEDLATTCARLPQIVTRFPGFKEKDKALFPISRNVPLLASRKYEMSKHTDGARATRELESAVAAFADAGNKTAPATDEERVVDDLYVTGNLYARSTWQRFTLRALEVRGMLSDAEKGRVADQGLCLMPYVRNHRASTTDDAPPPPAGLTTRPRATARSFAAQEAIDRTHVLRAPPPTRNAQLARERERVARQLLKDAAEMSEP